MDIIESYPPFDEKSLSFPDRLYQLRNRLRGFSAAAALVLQHEPPADAADQPDDADDQGKHAQRPFQKVRPRKCVKQQDQPEGCETERQQPLYPVQHLSAPPGAMPLLQARARSRWWWRAGRCGGCCSGRMYCHYRLGLRLPWRLRHDDRRARPLSCSRVANLALSPHGG